MNWDRDVEQARRPIHPPLPVHQSELRTLLMIVAEVVLCVAAVLLAGCTLYGAMHFAVWLGGVL